jgi:hypothetical protein
MCDKCQKIDGELERFRWLASQISDRRTLEGIGTLIARRQADKKALHPEDERRSRGGY